MVEMEYIPLIKDTMKTIFQSKTVWFNIITFVLIILALPQFISVEPSSWIPYIALLGAVGNTVLRVFFTAQPIQPIGFLKRG